MSVPSEPGIAAPIIRHNPDTVWPVPQRFREIYAHAVETPPGMRLQFVSGQVGVALDGSLAPDFARQCDQAITNVEALLTAARMTPSNIVKATWYLTRSEDLPALVEIRARRQPGIRPTVTVLVVAALARPEFLVEVEVIAADHDRAEQ